MKLLLELSMESAPLARAEALAANDALGGAPVVLDEDEGVLVVRTRARPEDLVRRLALCHHVSEWLGSCEPDGVDSLAERTAVPGPIRVRSTRAGESHRDIDLQSLSKRVGGILGRSRGVDLRSPRSDIRLVVSHRMHVGRRIGSVDRSSYERRRNTELPFRCPVTLHPKYARALVNLTRVPDGGTVLDPFCGTGGIVAEASLAGLRAVGSDLSEKMVSGTRRNLEQVRAEAELHVCDVSAVDGIVEGVDGIATDPPYGRSTSTDGESLDELYARSLRVFASVLGRGARVAVSVPSLDMLGGAEGFRLSETYPLRVHRSLTRNFCVLERV